MDSPSHRACGIAAGRLNLADYAANFSDAHPPLNRAQALIEAERCYYCYDAPCTTACPTSIDVPAFIARIAQDNVRGAAREILTANPLGGMCSRVCPTEQLCEQACVRNTRKTSRSKLVHCNAMRPMPSWPPVVHRCSSVPPPRAARWPWSELALPA